MAKLITKFKYLKPSARQSVGGYAKYIATREGVEKVDDTFKTDPSTEKQKKLIERILRDFPDSNSMLEYEDYLKEPTLGNASEFITRALEDNANEALNAKTYADYIATRPRAERFGSHGLFTDDGIRVKLEDVSKELNEYEGNVWTVIISLRREDAERLGFNSGERWRDMLRTQTEAIAKNFKIPVEDLKWYAAFHNESHHPHVHLMVYSSEQAKPYLTQKGIMNLRSAFAKDVFADDLLSIYEKQTEHRNALRAQSRDVIAEIVSRINNGAYDNPALENKLLDLADRLSKTSGKKQYGYLKADVKAIVNGIVSDLAADERISSLYDLWYEQREEVIRTYTEELPERIPLVDNPKFKSIKNMVIQEALNISADRVIADEQDEQAEVNAETSEPETDEVEDQEYAPAPRSVQRSRMWQLYRSAKELLDRESNAYDPNTAVDLLIEAAGLGCGVAKYRLGKMFLRGEDVPKNIDYALRWLEESVSEGNQYAEYLLGKTFLRGEDVDQDFPRAELLLRRSSDQGNRYASYTLGKTLLDGELLLQNIPEAIRLLTDSADKGFAAGQYQMGKLLYRGEVVPQDVSRAIKYLERSAEQKNPYAAYLAGKLRLKESEVKDVLQAICDFEIAAENGNDYAEYQLGKIYLYGKEVERDYEKAIAYLSSAAEHGNQYAEQLLHSIQSNRNWSAALGAIRLLHHLSRMIQNQLDDEKKGKAGAIDRKLKRKIDEKKQAHGLKQG
jgi:TPR repeat protein